MNRRIAAVSIAALSAWLVRPTPAAAHRLDEYLQATRISVDARHVGLEIDLTPGVSVARDVFGSIDSDRDGRISLLEAEAYGEEMLRSVELSVDHRPVPVTLVAIVVPLRSEMDLGLGTIRIRASAPSTGGGWGHHHVSYVNAHRSESSVYLVNVLVPSDPRFEIGRQQRDRLQHGLRFEYSVMPFQSWNGIYSLFAGLVMAGALVITRWPRKSQWPSSQRAPVASRVIQACGGMGSWRIRSTGEKLGGSSNSARSIGTVDN